jgi:hypothetical protein
MTSKTYLKEIFKNIYYKTFFKTSPITETLAPFQFDSFREETLKLKNEFLKRHALEIIDNGYTVVKNSVDSNLLDEFVYDFYN